MLLSDQNNLQNLNQFYLPQSHANNLFSPTLITINPSLASYLSKTQQLGFSLLLTEKNHIGPNLASPHWHPTCVTFDFKI